MFEELPLEFWLLYTLPMGANRSKEEVRARTLVGAIECLRAGITTVQDMLGLVPLTEGQTDVVHRRLSRGRHPRRVLADGVGHPADRHDAARRSLPPAVQEMLGNEPRPIRDQIDYLEQQFAPPSCRRHLALGGGAVRAAALLAANAAGLRRACRQTRSTGLHARL